VKIPLNDEKMYFILYELFTLYLLGYRTTVTEIR